jgi:hypothetical protein
MRSSISAYPELCAAGPGMNLEIAIIGVGFGEKLSSRSPLGAQPIERGSASATMPVRPRPRRVRSAERLADLKLDPAVAADRLVEPGALRSSSARPPDVPQVLILGLCVSSRRRVAVSQSKMPSAAPTTSDVVGGRLNLGPHGLLRRRSRYS